MRGAGYPREVKEVGGVGMKVIGVVADTAPSSGKGVMYGAFGGGGGDSYGSGGIVGSLWV